MSHPITHLAILKSFEFTRDGKGKKPGKGMDDNEVGLLLFTEISFHVWGAQHST